MRKPLKLALQVVAAVAAIVTVGAGYLSIAGIPTYPIDAPNVTIERTPERIARGERLATMLCAACHTDPTTRTWVGRELSDLPPVFGTAYSKNITQDPEHGIGSWTDGELLYMLRTGVRRDGQYTPPWMPKLTNMSDEDVFSIIAFLRSDKPQVKALAVEDHESDPSLFAIFLSHVAFKPMPMPAAPIIAPSSEDEVAYGRYLATGVLDCYPCHSSDFVTVDYLEPEKSEGFFGGGNELLGFDGLKVYSTNITSDTKHGIGSWKAADFDKLLRTGFRPDGSLVRFPMTPLPELTAGETAAIFAYLRTVPKLATPRKPSEEVFVPANATPGRRAYVKYGCVYCHADSGLGIGDLRQAARKYPDDAQLKAFIENPQTSIPTTVMPSFAGRIPFDDMQALLAHVRELGAQADSAKP